MFDSGISFRVVVWVQACIASVFVINEEISSFCTSPILITLVVDTLCSNSHDAVTNDLASIFVLCNVIFPVGPYVLLAGPHQLYLEGRVRAGKLVHELSCLFVVHLGIVSGLAECP